MGKTVARYFYQTYQNQGRFVGWRKEMTNGQGFEEDQLDDLCQSYRILHFTHIAAYSGKRNRNLLFSKLSSATF